MRLLLIVAVVFFAARVVAPVGYHFESGDLLVQLSPRVPGGKVVLELGPFGEVSWQTHRGPLDIRATFELGRRVGEFPPAEALRDLRVSFLATRMPWLLLLGAAVGALAASNGWRRVRPPLTGALCALVAGVLVVGITMLTFDARAFRDPRYRGPIEDAPRVIQLLKEARQDLAGVQRNINKMVDGLRRVHAQIVAGTPARAQETVRLLALSDIHNNPVGLLIAKELIRRFEVHGVLNAGDFTDRGTAPEGELFARFADLGVPHAIAAGNHEDVAAIQRVRRIPGVAVLDARTADIARVAGLTVLGDADPAAAAISSEPRTEERIAAVEAACLRLAERVEPSGAHVVLVHDRAMGECAAARARDRGIPLVFVWGHEHRQDYAIDGTVVSVSPGTSGANGIKSPRSAPYGFALLEFSQDDLALVSTCLFEFDGPSRLRTASCHLPNGEPEPAPSPAPPATPSPAPRRTATPSPTPSPIRPARPTPSPSS